VRWALCSILMLSAARFMWLRFIAAGLVTAQSWAHAVQTGQKRKQQPNQECVRHRARHGIMRIASEEVVVRDYVRSRCFLFRDPDTWLALEAFSQA
jgi:hypothetical protein